MCHHTSKPWDSAFLHAGRESIGERVTSIAWEDPDLYESVWHSQMEKLAAILFYPWHIQIFVKGESIWHGPDQKVGGHLIF